MTGTAALLVERGRTHGDFDDNAAVAQALKAAMRRSARWQRLNVDSPPLATAKDIALAVKRTGGGAAERQAALPRVDIEGPG